MTVTLIDASKLGHDEKIGKNKKRVLEDDEMKRIIDTFLAGKDVEDFAVSVKVEDMVEKKCSFSAGQYFEVKIEHVDITPEEFKAKMDKYKNNLSDILSIDIPFKYKIVDKSNHICSLFKAGSCKYPSYDCTHITGKLIQIDDEITTTDVRLIKWLTGYTVDAKFIESPYINKKWIC